MSLNLEKASTIAWIDDMCSNEAEEDSSPAVTKSLPDEQIPRDKRRLKVEGICIWFLLLSTSHTESLTKGTGLFSVFSEYDENAISKNQDNKQQSAVSQDTVNRCSFKTVHLCCLDISLIPSIYKGSVSPNSSLVPKSKHLNCPVIMLRCFLPHPLSDVTLEALHSTKAAPNGTLALWIEDSCIDGRFWDERKHERHPWCRQPLHHSWTQAYHKFQKCVISLLLFGIDARIMTAILWSWVCTNKARGYNPLASLAYK